MRRCLCLTLLAIGITASTVSAQPKKASSDDTQSLALEVAALRTLHRLELTDAQLEALQRLAKGCASPTRTSGRTKATANFVKSLTALRAALLDGDADKIDEQRDKVLQIMESDKIQIEDRVAISDAARHNASKVIRLLHPGQVLAYMLIFDDDEVDLLDLLEETLERGDKLSTAEWKLLRDRAAADGAWLIAGADDSRGRGAVKSLTSLLDQHHGAKSKSETDLTRQVATLTSGIDPFVMLRNAMERDVAEMLSNPRFAEAIQLALTHRKKTSSR
ncbi:MAG TPA: hypothetical protein VFE62_09905 [Gemmataceae bacterium]|nr:hypothetical protein [Gemmataceae bacterium]